MAEQDIHDNSFGSVGGRLRRAREAAGLSRTDIAARTKIAERHLAAIEDDRFDDLASSTYAVGFSRAYARAVGLEEREIAQSVREEIEAADRAAERTLPTFEPGDPARVPSSRTAWVAAAGALALIVAVFVLWRSYYAPAVALPDLTADEAPAAPPVQAAAPAPSVTAPQGSVVVTAREAGIWIKVSDVAGNQLFQKELAAGESYSVPSDAQDPQLRTARPDALAITVSGRPVPPLSNKAEVLTVPVSAAALLARAAPQGTIVPLRSPSDARAPASAAPATSQSQASPAVESSGDPAATETRAAPPASPAVAAAQPAAEPLLTPAPAAAGEVLKASTVSE